MANLRMNDDLNIVAESPLVIEKLGDDLNIIQKLDDEPNDVGGMTSTELKETFDRSGNLIKAFINDKLIPAVLASDATEAARAAAETAREQAEAARKTAETAREQAETAREEHETIRVRQEQERVAAEQARDEAEKARVDSTTGIMAQATTQADAAKTAAQGAARDAEAAAQDARTAAAAAQGAAKDAGDAEASAGSAAKSEQAAQTASAASQSWAAGGTGTRPDEETNNAKYWAGVAEKAAGGGVTSFNGRAGVVTPKKGDYTAEMVGARPDTWTPGAADVNAVPTSEKGKPNGVASLGADGKVPTGQLPTMDCAPKSHVHDASQISTGILPVTRGGTGVTSLAELAAAMGAAKSESGSYIGTGKDASSGGSRSSLTFSETPKLVVISGQPIYSRDKCHDMCFIMSNVALCVAFNQQNNVAEISYLNLSISNGTVQWWTSTYNKMTMGVSGSSCGHSNKRGQMDEINVTYHYIAFF